MSELQTIVLAGGCFWCTEAVFKEVRGVTDVESGYSNGETQRPSYEQVCTGRTGYNEVVKLITDIADTISGPFSVLTSSRNISVLTMFGVGM